MVTRLYAHVASNTDNALTIIDVTDPAAPVLTGSIQGAGAPNFLNLAFSVFVLGNYAYVGCTTEDSLTIIDIADPATPTFKGHIAGSGAPNFLNFAREVFVVGTLAYIVAQSDNALTIIDVTDPAAPTLKGSIQGTGAPNFLGGAFSVFVVGNFAYVACNSNDALTIIDVTDPAAPTFKGSIQGAGGPNFLNGAEGVFVLGNYAYVAAVADNALTIIDVTNPAVPVLKGSIQGVAGPNFLAGAQGVFVEGNYAYVACSGDDALTIIDVTDPAVPVFKGSIQGAGAPNFLNGAFEVKVQGNYAYVACSVDDALTIIDVTDPAAPTFKGSIQGAGGPNFLNGASGVSLVSGPPPPEPAPPEPGYAPGGNFSRRLSGGAAGFLSYISPDGIVYPFHTPHEIGRWVVSFAGFGTPPIEYITERGPFQHGATVRDYFLRPRVIQLLIRQAFCDRVAWWGGRADLLNEIRPNRQLTPTAVVPGELQLVETDGTVRSLSVWIQEGPRFEPREPNQWDEWAFQEVLRFIAYDPVAFDPSEVTAAFVVALEASLVFPITFPITFGTGDLDETLAVPYLGTWLSFPVITVTGPIELPRLDNNTTGEKLEFSTNIAPGRTITIDLTEGVKTVVDDLGNNLIGTLTSDSDLGTFHLAPDPEAPLGVNTLRLRGTNPAGLTAVSLAYFDRYFGF